MAEKRTGKVGTCGLNYIAMSVLPVGAAVSGTDIRSIDARSKLVIAMARKWG